MRLNRKIIFVSFITMLFVASCSQNISNEYFSFSLLSNNACQLLNNSTYSIGESDFNDFKIVYNNARLKTNYHVELSRGGVIRNNAKNGDIKISSITVSYEISPNTPYGQLRLKTSSSYITDYETGGTPLVSGVAINFDNIESQPNYFSIYSPTSNYFVSSITFTYRNISKVEEIKADRTLNIYSMNDMHGKIEYMDGYYPGSSKLTNYFNIETKNNADNSLFLSSGDMFQGYADSNITHGDIGIQYMNNVGFSAMAIGNHEFDWGQSELEVNVNRSNFPYLGLNLYDRDTNERVSWIKPSTIINKNGLKIGVIGATTAYDSISNKLVKNLEFKKGSALFSLVKDESDYLRSQGADFVIYLVHNGVSSYGTSSSYDNVDFYSTSFGDNSDVFKDNKYIDFVIEGHTHQNYQIKDNKNVWHVQSSGDGQSVQKTSVKFTYVNNKYVYSTFSFKSTSKDTLLNIGDEIVFGNYNTKGSIYKYYYDTKIKDIKEQVAIENSSGYSSAEIGQMAATEYYNYYKDKALNLGYTVLLGGGQFKLRSPYKLPQGTITYGDILTVLPFDNTIGIASALGSKINRIFGENKYSYYYNYPLSFEVEEDKTYYIITDSWTYGYSSNNMTLIHEFDDLLYARDMVFTYLKNI